MPVRRIIADFTVKDGVMETRNLLLDSEIAVVSGVGKVRLGERTVDFQLAVNPLQPLERRIGRIPLVGSPLLKDHGLAVTYFNVKGPWTDHAVSVAPLKLLNQTVVDVSLLPFRLPERLIGPAR